MKKILSFIFVIITLFTTTVISSAEDASRVVKISVPDIITYSEKNNYRKSFDLKVDVYDWEKYSELSLIINYNPDIFSPLFQYAMGTKYYVQSDADYGGKRICTVIWSKAPLHHDKRDISFDVRFAVYGVGAHNVTFEVEAYDHDGNKVEVDLQIDNKIYPEVLSAEEVGVGVIDALTWKETRICEKYGLTVQDIQNKIKSENFRIKDKNGNLLSADDIVPNGAVIEIIYNGLIAYSTTICIAYDVDCDGEVTASDARLALRCAAQLNGLSSRAYFAADIDGKSGITASDARLILRKAAQLD